MAVFTYFILLSKTAAFFKDKDQHTSKFKCWINVTTALMLTQETRI